VRRTVTVTENPRIELALRELEAMITAVSGTSVTVTSNDETIVVTSANHTQGTESGVYVDTDLGDKNVYLTGTPIKGQKYKVGNRGTNKVIVNGVGRKINGDSTMTILYEYSTAQLQYSGTEWMVI
jgi:hypothetical protein